jgi:ATP-dependent protease HslVU (ClpYQ) ATPase subunit
MSILLEDVLYQVPDEKIKTVKITSEDVKKKLREIVSDEDLTKYIL